MSKDQIERRRRFELRIGRHKGKTLQKVANKDMGWLVWATGDPGISEGPTRTAIEEFFTYQDIREMVEKFCEATDKPLPRCLQGDTEATGDAPSEGDDAQDDEEGVF